MNEWIYIVLQEITIFFKLLTILKYFFGPHYLQETKKSTFFPFVQNLLFMN